MGNTTLTGGGGGTGTGTTTPSETWELVNAKPANADGNDEDRVEIALGNPLASMRFEKVGGVWTYRGQNNEPKFAAQPFVGGDANSTAIAAELGAGELYFFDVYDDPNPDHNGAWTVNASGVIQQRTCTNGTGASSGTSPATPTLTGTATEAIFAGAFVNVIGSSIRLADASDPAKPANGFVLAAIGSGATGDYLRIGENTQVTGATLGPQWLSATNPGQATAVAPTTAGQIKQYIGEANSATEISFEPDQPILLA